RLPRRLPRRPRPPLFAEPRLGRPAREANSGAPAQPHEPATADARCIGLAPGRRLRTRVAGVFLFLPLLARLGFDTLVRQAGYPGSRMIPGPVRLDGSGSPWASPKRAVGADAQPAGRPVVHRDAWAPGAG